MIYFHMRSHIKFSKLIKDIHFTLGIVVMFIMTLQLFQVYTFCKTFARTSNFAQLCHIHFEVSCTQINE